MDISNALINPEKKIYLYKNVWNLLVMMQVHWLKIEWCLHFTECNESNEWHIGRKCTSHNLISIMRYIIIQAYFSSDSEREWENERVKEKSVQYTINLWIYGIEIALSVSSMHCVFHSLSNNVHPLTNVFLAQYALWLGYSLAFGC